MYERVCPVSKPPVHSAVPAHVTPYPAARGVVIVELTALLLAVQVLGVMLQPEATARVRQAPWLDMQMPFRPA